MNTQTMITYFGEQADPLRPTVCHHCAGNGYEPVADPFTHAQALEPCPRCAGSGEEHTLCSCPACGWQGGLDDLVLDYVDDHFVACCPQCARDEADGIDLDVLPGGHCTMPL